MKKGLHRIVILTLSICLGAAIVGSISGTVAWYQYSTRVSTAYLGTTAGTAGNLKLRIKGTDSEFVNSLTKDNIADYLANHSLGKDIIPITAGNMKEEDPLKTIGGTGANKNLPKFYKNPIRGFSEKVPYTSGSWLEADTTMYVSIPLELCFEELDGVKTSEVDKAYLEKDVYLSELLIQEDYQNKTDPEDLKKDLSSAIRVHISSYRDDDESEGHATSAINKLISKNGGTILTEGYLDLDGDTNLDTVTVGDDAGAKYGFGNPSEVEVNNVVYGEGTQTAYRAASGGPIDGSYKNLAEETVNEKVYPAVVKSVGNSVVLDEEDYKFTKEGASSETDKKIGTTIGYEKGDDGFESKYLNVVITIWLEGWQTLPTKSNPNVASSIWDAADYIGSMFDVGIQFAVQAK